MSSIICIHIVEKKKTFETYSIVITTFAVDLFFLKNIFLKLYRSFGNTVFSLMDSFYIPQDTIKYTEKIIYRNICCDNSLILHTLLINLNEFHPIEISKSQLISTT